MRRSGARRLALLPLLPLLPLLLAACMYGFAGGGLPAHIRTLAVLPLENLTSTAGLADHLQAELRRELEARLGLRTAPEATAHAVLRGRVTRYEVDAPTAYDPERGGGAARRALQIVADIEIVDQTTGKVLWARTGLSATGEYAERAEAVGRAQAIEKLVSEVINGAQSQW